MPNLAGRELLRDRGRHLSIPQFPYFHQSPTWYHQWPRSLHLLLVSRPLPFLHLSRVPHRWKLFHLPHLMLMPHPLAVPHR